jgi:hypothetical protein
VLQLARAATAFLSPEVDAAAGIAATPAAVDRSAWRRLTPALFFELDLDIFSPVTALPARLLVLDSMSIPVDVVHTPFVAARCWRMAPSNVITPRTDFASGVVTRYNTPLSVKMHGVPWPISRALRHAVVCTFCRAFRRVPCSDGMQTAFVIR